MSIYVLYHVTSDTSPCADGLGAKYAAWRKFGENATYLPVQYKNPPPLMPPQSTVYIVDFSYPREVIEQLRSVHKQVTVIDHHKTAEEALRGLEGCCFDMSKSGAVLAWEYFHPGIEIPKLLLHIQDRDLWHFKIPGSKAIHAALPLLGNDMTNWNRSVYGLSKTLSLPALEMSGNAVLFMQNKTIEASVQKYERITLCNKEVAMLNTSELHSEIGNRLCLEQDVDFACCYTIHKDQEVSVSLRSIGEMDVSAIAKHWGGGGHKNAAGCTWSVQTLLEVLAGEHA